MSDSLTSLGECCVLVVDDDAFNHDLVASLLEMMGIDQVICAEDGIEALEKARAKVPDLIILDIMMPRMDGPTLVDHIRAKLPTIKVIFISGYAEDTFGERLSGEKGLHFLPKPYTEDQLGVSVQNLLAA